MSEIKNKNYKWDEKSQQFVEVSSEPQDDAQQDFQNGVAETDALAAPIFKPASENGESSLEEDFSVLRLGDAETTDITVEDWIKETEAGIREDMTADELDAWINRPGGPSDDQYSFLEEKEIYEANKDDKKKGKKPKTLDRSPYMVELFEGSDLGQYANQPFTLYSKSKQFLEEERKQIPLINTKLQKEFDDEIYRLDYLANNMDTVIASDRANRFLDIKNQINNYDTQIQQAESDYENGEISLDQKELTIERLNFDKNATIENLSPYDKQQYDKNLKILNEVTTASDKDTYSSFSKAGEEKANLNNRVEQEILTIALQNDKLQGKILDGNLNLAGKESLIQQAKSVVLEDDYNEYLDEFNKAEEIIFSFEDMSDITPEAATKAQNIIINAGEKVQDSFAELSFNVGEGVFLNSFEMTDEFQEWRDRHIKDMGVVGDLLDAGGTLVQGLQQIGGEFFGGSAIWLNEVAFAGLEKVGIEAPTKYGLEYNRLDMVQDWFENYNNFNYLGVSDLGGSISQDGFSFRSGTKTIANLLPFTIGVAMSARKGDIKGTRRLFSALKGMGASPRVINSIKMGGFAYGATVNDNFNEGKQLGLSTDAAIAYSSMASTATALVQSIMPDANFFKTNVGNTIKQQLVENLKKAGSAEARKAVGKQFFNNLIGELGEEEAELALQDLAKITVGLSNDTQFWDWDTQLETIAGTILLTGSTSAAMSSTQYNNFKNKVYNTYRLQGKDVISTLNEAKKQSEAKLKRARSVQGKENAQRQLDQINAALSYGNEIMKAINVAPDIMNDNQIDLLIQKSKLISQRDSKRVGATAEIDQQIADIDAQIAGTDVTKQSEVIQKRTEAGVQKIAGDLGIEFEKGNTEQAAKLIEEENKRRKKSKEKPIDVKKTSNDNGFIIQNPDGSQKIFINEDVAGDNKAVTTAQHELLHGVLLKTIKDNPNAIVQMSNALRSEIDKMIPTGVSFNNSYINARLEAYKTDPDSIKAEELLTIFSEGLTQGFIAFEENAFTKIGDSVRRALQSLGLRVKFNSGRDVYNFIKDFNKSVEMGQGLSKGLQRTATKGAKIGTKLGSSSAFLYNANFENAVQTIYAEESDMSAQQKAIQIALVYKDKVAALINKSSGTPFGLKENYAAMENVLIGKTNANSIFNIVINYNPDSGISLDQTIGRSIAGQIQYGNATVKSSANLSREAEQAKKILNDLSKEDGFNPQTGRDYEIVGGQLIGMASAQVFKRFPSLDDGKKEELTFDIIERVLRKSPGKQTSADLNWDGRGDFYGFLNGRISDRMLDALKQNPDYLSQIDQNQFDQLEKEASKVTNEISETKVEDKPVYANLIKTKVLPPDLANAVKAKVLSTIRVLKTRIDASAGKNASVTPIINDIKNQMGKQADIEFKKMLGTKKGDALKNNLLKLKKPILENMTTTWLMQAMPFAVQKSVGGSYRVDEDGKRIKNENDEFIFDPKFTLNWQGQKIDRAKTSTDQQGKTSGPEIVKRVPAGRITDEQFLSYMFEDGEIIRGRKESLAKAMAEEYSFDLLNSELQDPTSKIREAFENNQELLGVTVAENFIQDFARQAERGTVKRSGNVAMFEEMLSLEIRGDIDGSAAMFESLSKEDKEFWQAATSDLRVATTKYKAGLKKLNVPQNVKQYLDQYFKNPSAKTNKQAMKEMNEFSLAMIDALPNSIVKALGADFFGAHYRYLNPKDGRSMGAKIKAKIDALPETDSDITLIQAGFGFVGTLTKDVLYKDFKTVQEKIDYLTENYGDKIEALNTANKAAIEMVVKTAYDLAIKNPEYTIGFLRMLESTTNIGKSLRALTGIIDIQMTAESQAVYVNKKTGQGYGNTLTDAQRRKLKSGEIVINEKHPNYKDAQKFIKDGSKQTLAQLLRIKGEHATPSSNFNLKLADQFLTALSIGLENPGGVEQAKNSLVANTNSLAIDFNQQLNTKVLSDIQDAKLGSTSDIGDLRLLALPEASQASFFDIEGRQTIGRVQRLVKEIFNKDKTKTIAKINTEQKAINEGIKSSKPTKGISVYDFDDTLAFSKSEVIVKMPQDPEILDIAARRMFAEEFKDKPGFLRTFDNLTKEQQEKVSNSVPRSTKKITPAEFAKQGDKLAKEGAEFDFSEFSKVVQGTPGPLAPRLKKAIEKFGNQNIFVLTARPAESANAIHAFLKGIGLEIPIKNITGLANGAPSAKADWMVGKVSEGYNDFYFVDDHLGNVKAVKDILDTFDVKGKVQQARVKRSANLSIEINEMIERNKGVRAETTYSKIKARKDGARKGRFKFFLPYGAEDFRGLTSYTLAGKGKQGEADQKWFDDNLVKPYLRGIAAMEVAKRALKNDFSSLLRSIPGLKKRLNKRIGDTDYTVDQAVRVYLWTQQGFQIPDISKRDQKKLNSLVKKDPSLVSFAESLQAISKKDKWVEPADYWIAGSILKDINDIGEKTNRAEYLQEFNQSVDIVFSEQNLNKLEAIYGTRYVNALKNSIARMKSGRNRPSQPGAYEQRWLNWVNNSVGTIMFFNRRSAMMQMLSFANFVNWSDNNPLKAGIAFANQPAYWKAWSKIFNSPKLKERRGGLKSDVQEQEIASQAKNSKDKASAVIAYLLKIGFTPTQLADSFAIATGGATFLINRTKTYKKQGLSQAEAEAKAFEDFSAISDETQQSGDPMLISAQQASHLGRLVLAFQNTPMQYTRLMKKAGQDLINGRGDAKTNISKIAYYGFVQNLIFSGLQNALFALIPGFDDEEKEDEQYEKIINTKTERIVNSMVDTILRGSGLTGAVVSTLKNTINRYYKEEKKGYNADHAYTLLELANVSPPIGSKLRKVYGGIQTKKFDRDVMEAQGWDVTLDGRFNISPNYEILGSLTSAGLNLPLDRALAEVDAISEMLDARNTSYQRIALGLGWRTWDVNADKEEEEKVKVEGKARRKVEGQEKAKRTRAESSAKLRELQQNLTIEQANTYGKWKKGKTVKEKIKYLEKL